MKKIIITSITLFILFLSVSDIYAAETDPVKIEYVAGTEEYYAPGYDGEGSFVYWTTEKDKSGDIYYPGDRIPAPDEEGYYLYPVFRENTRITGVPAEMTIYFGSKKQLNFETNYTGTVYLQKYNSSKKSWKDVSKGTAKDGALKVSFPYSASDGRFRIYAPENETNTSASVKFSVTVRYRSEKITVSGVPADMIKIKGHRYSKEYSPKAFNVEFRLKRGYKQTLRLKMDGKTGSKTVVSTPGAGTTVAVEVPKGWAKYRDRQFELVSTVKSNEGTKKTSYRFRIHVTDGKERLFTWE